MSNSRRKTPIFGHCGKSEKKDKRLANRKFRRLERKKIKTDDFESIPTDLDEVSNVWSMNKDGKGYWADALIYQNGKFMRK